MDFVMQSSRMNPNWAEENLQTIRTLMERSALYRRALAPVMIFSGALGSASAIVGRFLNINSPRGFIGFWGGVAFVALAGSFLLMRRQALKDAEPIWSPPARRVTQAFLPPLAAGFMISIAIALRLGSAQEVELQNLGRTISMLWLPLGWVVLYGCALHAAGFFMPRSIKLLGWTFVLGGTLLFEFGVPTGFSHIDYAYVIMGFFFGVLQSGLWRVPVLDRKRKECGVNPEPFLQLDRVIHEKGRLAIMSMLAASPELSFTELRDALTMTDGNLTTHIRALATGRLRGRGQILSKQPAAHHLLAHRGRAARRSLNTSICWSKSSGKTGPSKIYLNKLKPPWSFTL